jgi:hypothetical protein
MRELVLPSQFGLPMVPPVDLPLKKSKKEKKRARQYQAPIVSVPGDEDGFDTEEEASNLVDAPVTKTSR